jgi:hypothetical protein
MTAVGSGTLAGAGRRAEASRRSVYGTEPGAWGSGTRKRAYHRALARGDKRAKEMRFMEVLFFRLYSRTIRATLSQPNWFLSRLSDYEKLDGGMSIVTPLKLTEND